MNRERLDEVEEGARIFVQDWAKLAPGERVLVLADDTSEPEVRRLVLEQARASGAEVTYLEMAKPESAWAEPSEVVLGAMKQAQKCLSLALVYHDRRTTIARREHGMAMFFLLPPRLETLRSDASRFPIELCAEIGRRCAARLRAASEIRIRSARGTDFSAALDPRNCTADPGGWREEWDPGRTIGRTPGEGSNTFPPGVVLASPSPGSVNGVAVFEHHVGVGPVASHLAVRYEEGRCVAAQGEGAETLAALVAEAPHSTDVAEIAWGTNPHQTLTLDTLRNPIDAERHAGTVHVGIGPSPIFGNRTASRLHLDGLVIAPSIFLDGEQLMRDGHLLVLDDPELRAFAERFGDPDTLLRERFPISPPALAGLPWSGPAALSDAWVALEVPAAAGAAVAGADRGQAGPLLARLAGDGTPDEQLQRLAARLLENARGREEGRWLLSLYRFNIEFATSGGESCHLAIDHGAAAVLAGPAPGERLMTVRVECDLPLLAELVAGQLGPVDANLSGGLWVSGSLGTRVLTSCTFRLMRIAQDGFVAASRAAAAGEDLA